MLNRTKLQDLITGKNVWKYYQLYNVTQWYSEEEMRKFQIEKLKLLLNHCYRNIPYYNEIINKQNIDITNITSLDVLKDFPILTKEIIQSNYYKFIPNNNKSIKGVKIKQTGGTTGNILFNRNDSITRSSTWGSYKRYQDWMGLNDTSKTLILFGGHVKKNLFRQGLTSTAQRLLENSISVDIYNTSNETIEKVIKLLQNNSFAQIRSYPQFLFSVAQKLEIRGLTFKVKSISTTAEPVMPEHRLLFKKVFQAEVFDQYGCGEIGGIAYECYMHEGLHIAEERVIIEHNEANELIITDLDNYTMPFIRYWNADQAIFSENKCSCGRQSRLIKQIIGRTCDYVIGVDGQFLHWAYFWHLIFDSNIAKNRNLKKFQVLQESKDKIIIRLVCDTLTIEERDFLVSNIQEHLGAIHVMFSYEKDIENSLSGKYRPVINKLI